MGMETSWQASAPKSEERLNTGGKEQRGRIVSTPKGVLRRTGWLGGRSGDWSPGQPPALACTC